MISIRKFAYAAILTATTLTFAPRPASAQEAARGHFTLTHDVRWGIANVPAGDYVFSFDPQNTTSVLTLSKMSGARAGFIVLVPSTEQAKPSTTSRLVIASSPEGSYVSAMDLPEFGMTLHFTTPSYAGEKQIAKAATTAPAGQ